LQKNLEQAANLLHAQVNSASYPQWDGKCVVACQLWGKDLMWMIVAVVCLQAANCRPLLFTVMGNGINGHIVGAASMAQS